MAGEIYTCINTTNFVEELWYKIYIKVMFDSIGGSCNTVVAHWAAGQQAE